MIEVLLTIDALPSGSNPIYGIYDDTDVWVFEKKQWFRLDRSSSSLVMESWTDPPSKLRVPTDSDLSPDDVQNIAFSLGKTGAYVAVVRPSSVGMMCVVDYGSLDPSKDHQELHKITDEDVQRARNELKTKFLLQV